MSALRRSSLRDHRPATRRLTATVCLQANQLSSCSSNLHTKHNRISVFLRIIRIFFNSGPQTDVDLTSLATVWLFNPIAVSQMKKVTFHKWRCCSLSLSSHRYISLCWTCACHNVLSVTGTELRRYCAPPYATG
jgi:hypothetical protein